MNFILKTVTYKEKYFFEASGANALGIEIMQQYSAIDLSQKAESNVLRHNQNEIDLIIFN